MLRVFFLLFMVLALPRTTLAAEGTAPKVLSSSPDKELFRATLREVIKEDPSLILDVLRENSEIVLEIAQMGSDLKRRKILLSQWITDMQVPKTANLKGRPFLGPENAPVTITVFTDFTCMYCQQGEHTVNSIYKSYGGKVRVVYKMLPMSGHPGAIEAAQFMLAAYKQNPEKSWKLFEEFFNHRDDIIGKGSDAFLRSAAMEMGFDMKRLLADASGKEVQALMKEDEKDANTLSVKGTPFFLVNNIVVRGALEEPLFREAVELALRASAK